MDYYILAQLYKLVEFICEVSSNLTLELLIKASTNYPMLSSLRTQTCVWLSLWRPVGKEAPKAAVFFCALARWFNSFLNTIFKTKRNSINMWQKYTPTLLEASVWRMTFFNNPLSTNFLCTAILILIKAWLQDDKKAWMPSKKNVAACGISRIPESGLPCTG